MSSSLSSESNPFNDTRLEKKFTWHKRIEKLKQQGLTKKEIEASDRKRLAGERMVCSVCLFFIRQFFCFFPQKDLQKAKEMQQKHKEEEELWGTQKAAIEKDRQEMDYLDWKKQEEIV